MRVIQSAFSTVASLRSLPAQLDSSISETRKLKLWNKCRVSLKSDPKTISVELEGRAIRVPSTWSAVDLLRDANQTSILKNALALVVDHQRDMPVCLHAPLGRVLQGRDTHHLKIISANHLKDIEEQKAAFKVFWHSSAHILGAAIQRVYGSENALLCHGPATDRGFYYDVMFVSPQVDLSTKDGESAFDQLAKLIPHHEPPQLNMNQLEESMKIICNEAKYFERKDIFIQDALEMFKENPFKLHYIRRAMDMGSESVGVYKCGDFIDLCRGPHVYSTELLGLALSLDSQSTLVHWPAALKFVDQHPQLSEAPLLTRQFLNRINGISFPSQKMMETFIQQKKEASERDHRHIGTQQQLFMMHPQTPGTLFLLPHGTRMIKRLKELLRSQYAQLGYEEVSTPLIYDKEIWERSGHWENYRDDMYLVKGGITAAQQHTPPDSSILGLKPMNCPAHCLIYKNTSRSFRDLPLRIADFSPLHRNELSGTLTGLTRLRQFHQDDAHIFCTPDQMLGEIETTLNLFHRLYKEIFGFPSYELVLSTRPLNGIIGSHEEWDAAEKTLKQALSRHYETKFPEKMFRTDEGAGAFYGPKIDLLLKDSQQRTHQLATLQLDFQLPRRFNLTYDTSEIGKNERPVMIHRAALGSLERFWAVWMEETRGKWPFWVSPRQLKIIPILNPKKYPSEPVLEYAQKVAAYLQRRFPHSTPFTAFDQSQKAVGEHDMWWASRFHVDVDETDHTLNKKILEAQQQRYNYTVVIGQREVQNGQVSVRRRDISSSETLTVDAFHQELLQKDATFQ